MNILKTQRVHLLVKVPSINTNSSIVEHGIIKPCIIVDHDYQIGIFDHLASGTTLNDGVSISDYIPYFGTNSTLVQWASIGECALIRGRSVVLYPMGDYQKINGRIRKLIRYFKKLELEYSLHEELMAYVKE